MSPRPCRGGTARCARPRSGRREGAVEADDVVVGVAAGRGKEADPRPLGAGQSRARSRPAAGCPTPSRSRRRRRRRSGASGCLHRPNGVARRPDFVLVQRSELLGIALSRMYSARHARIARHRRRLRHRLRQGLSGAAKEFYGGLLGLESSADYGKIPGGEFETGNLTLQVMDAAAVDREFQAQHPPDRPPRRGRRGYPRRARSAGGHGSLPRRSTAASATSRPSPTPTATSSCSTIATRRATSRAATSTGPGNSLRGPRDPSKIPVQSGRPLLASERARSGENRCVALE